MAVVDFAFLTGVRQSLFSSPRLIGSWAGGKPSDDWSTSTMQSTTGSDGCPCFTAAVELEDACVGRTFSWGVMLDGPAGPNLWAITTELSGSADRHRTFTLRESGQRETYQLTRGRALGANRLVREGAEEGARFAVWAPNASSVALVWGNTVTGFIADDGSGRDPAAPDIALARPTGPGASWDGVWETAPDEPALSDFNLLVFRPYMFRVVQDDGSIVMKTDLYSRSQLGSGGTQPGADTFSGSWKDLDGTVSCSLVRDPDVVAAIPSLDAYPPGPMIGADEFWSNEFDPHNPVPTRLRDMSIYILHVGGLGYGRESPGTLLDAMAHLDHVVALGMNTVHLMPLSQFEGRSSWGYGPSHFFAVDFAEGGPSLLKHFVREAHRRGVAVILDVVYNHYAQDVPRAEWAFDSNAPDRNIYYEYIGKPGDYPRPDGGYVDNGSSGYAPRFSEEMVRSMMISSAVAYAVEFHIDGFRLDLTSAIHADACLHADGRAADTARAAGQKFLREFNLTLKLVKPTLVVVAEDYSGWPAVTQGVDAGGLGFEARWYIDFYHHLIGDSGRGPDYANLLRVAATSDTAELALDFFAGALQASAVASVVYHESHDEAGNASWKLDGVDGRTARTISAAVNRAPLVGDTRWWAEARCRIAAGMTMLAPATPMFFMGEEVGFQNDYTFDGFLSQREDFTGLRSGVGASLFRFYQDIIRFRVQHPVTRDAGIEILHVHRANRVLVFRRRGDGPDLVVAASLAVQPFSNGYVFPLPPDAARLWKEVFNSDSRYYGGNDTGNGGRMLGRSGDGLNIVLPATGFVVLEAQH